MVKARKPLTKGVPRIQLTRSVVVSNLSDSSVLLLQRLKELDREFARQTRQLSKLTKEIRQRIIEKM